MSEARVGKHTFVYNGERYFRDKSENVLMGSVGEKTDQLGTKAGLDVADHIPRALLKGRVRYVTTADIEWNRQAKADVEAAGRLKYFTAEASGTETFSYEKARSGSLKLAKFVIDERPLQMLLNNEAAAARKILAQERGDGRVVSTIWVVVEGTIAESFATSGTSTGDVEAEITPGAQLQLTAKHAAGVRGKTTIVLEKGTTFAYLMHKVQKWNKDRSRIEELDVDAKGLS